MNDFSIKTSVLETTLNTYEKFVLMLLLHHRNTKTKLCFPSLELLTKEMSCSTKTITRTLKSLKDKEIISWEKGTNNRNLYKINNVVLDNYDRWKISVEEAQFSMVY